MSHDHQYVKLVPSQVDYYFSGMGRLLFRMAKNQELRSNHRAVARIVGHDPRKIRTTTHATELAALYKIASRCPQNAAVLEIGSYLGASSCYIAAALTRRSGRVFCVDTWQNDAMSEGGRDTFAEFSQNTRGVKDVIVPVRKCSSDLLASDIRPPLDLAFIDGDHSYDGARSDFAKVAPWVAGGGVVAFHDCVGGSHPGVARAAGEALATGQWDIAGQVRSLLWLVRRQPERLPPLA